MNLALAATPNKSNSNPKNSQSNTSKSVSTLSSSSSSSSSTLSSSKKVAKGKDLPDTRGVAEALSEVGPLFAQTLTDIFVAGGGIGALFNGAVERMLFFGPAAMIFFAMYDSIYVVISALHTNMKTSGVSIADAMSGAAWPF